VTEAPVEYSQVDYADRFRDFIRNFRTRPATSSTWTRCTG